MTSPEETALVTWIAIFAPIATAVIGYVLTNLHKNISTVDKAAKERHEVHEQAILSMEERLTRYVHDVEQRDVKRVEDAEARAEKGDERILQQVQNNYSDLQRQLQTISDDVKKLTRDGCGALAACLSVKGD